MKLIKESTKYEVRKYTKDGREIGSPVIFDTKKEVSDRMDLASAEYIGAGQWENSRFIFKEKEIEG